MRERWTPESFRIEFFSEIERSLYGFLSFARQSNDEVAMDPDADLFAILGEFPGLFDRRAFFDVLQNLRISGFISDDEQTRARIRHRLQSLVVAVDARRA